MDAAAAHCAHGLGIWAWASNDTASTDTTGSGERAEHRAHARRTGEDLPEVCDLTWPAA
jgi:phosphoketolase